MATQVLMSLEEFHALPERKGIEYQLLRGKLIEVSGPNFEHGDIETNFSWKLRSYVAEIAHDYKVACNTGFVLSQQTELVPDVCVIHGEKLRSLEVVRGALRGAPDLAVEIVSPNESSVDLDEKVAEYLAAGTQIVWVAYPKTRQVVAHDARCEIRNFTIDQILDTGDVLPGLQIPVQEIFPAR